MSSGLNDLSVLHVLGTFLVLRTRQQVILQNWKSHLYLDLCHLPRAEICHLPRFLAQNLDQSQSQCRNTFYGRKANVDGTMNAGLTFAHGTSNTITTTDAKAASLVFGSTGRTDLLTLKTSDNNEAVIVKGTTNVLAFHVDLGDATFDEDVTIGGALTMTGSSISIPDNQAASVAIGSTGRTDLLTLKTSSNTEAVIVKGTTNVLAFHVNLGTATFDETVTIKGNSVTLGGDSTFTLQRPTHGSTDGGDFVIQGQTAAGTDKTGGDVSLLVVLVVVVQMVLVAM
jgi:hypothetical protein